jgi:hypothetical protein
MESYENLQPSQFRYPIFHHEVGEFERVSEELHIPLDDLLDAAESGKLQLLNDDLWGQLHNSESFSIDKGEWDKVAAIANEHGKDWQTPKKELESQKTLSAPIIVKQGERYTLVSGNTRLLVSRALGITPTVLVFEVVAPEEVR